MNENMDLYTFKTNDSSVHKILNLPINFTKELMLLYHYAKF